MYTFITRTTWEINLQTVRKSYFIHCSSLHPGWKLLTIYGFLQSLVHENFQKQWKQVMAVPRYTYTHHCCLRLFYWQWHCHYNYPYFYFTFFTKLSYFILFIKSVDLFVLQNTVTMYGSHTIWKIWRLVWRRSYVSIFSLGMPLHSGNSHLTCLHSPNSHLTYPHSFERGKATFGWVLFGF